MFRQDCSCPALLEDCRSGFPYGAVTRYGPPFQTLPVPKSTAAGLVRFRSPLLAESRLMSVPPATEMFQFAGFASRTYEFSAGYPRVKPVGGLPHSEIPGSTIARISPGLFAACRVLHRLSVPRHPPDALHSRSITRDAAPREMTRRSSARPAAPRKTAAHRGKPHPLAKRGATPPAAARMKTLSSDGARRTGSDPTGQPPHRTTACARGPSASVTFTNPLHPSINTSPTARSGTSPGGAPIHHRGAKLCFSDRRLRPKPRPPMVEVNGIEPMTSCLQSRRSPN
jgi:hypothetical protein